MQVASDLMALPATGGHPACVPHSLPCRSHCQSADLPIFVENAWTPAENCPRIYGSPATLDSVQKHIFNNVMWPDFVALSGQMPPFLHLYLLQVEVPVEADGLQITPVQVNHLVPTFGYVVSNGTSAVIFGDDSGPTKRPWEIAHQTGSSHCLSRSMFSKLLDESGRGVPSHDARNVRSRGC